jgi:hypothetical protein
VEDDLGLDVSGNERTRFVEGRLGDLAEFLRVLPLEVHGSHREGGGVDGGRDDPALVGAGEDDAELDGRSIVLTWRDADDDAHFSPPVESESVGSEPGPGRITAPNPGSAPTPLGPASASCLPRTEDLRPKMK